MIYCCNCGRDMDAIGQDNISPFSGYPLCEDCGVDDKVLKEVQEVYENDEY